MTKRPAKCRRCGRWDTEAGRISHAGLCMDCGTNAVMENAISIAAKSGPAYERWRAGVEASNRRRFGSPHTPGL